MTRGSIVAKALAASTVADAAAVQELIRAAFGERFERPLGDTWGNMGLITGGGSFDHKALENVTNMQDAILERLAVLKHGSVYKTPYASPLEAAEDLLKGIDPEEVNQLSCVDFRESDPPATKSKHMTIVFRDRGCGIAPDDVARTIFALGSQHKNAIAWQQGAFGVGGKTTYRNARYVVLVTRRDPSLFVGVERDVISVAVLEWRRDGKKDSAVYLVDRHWTGPGDHAALPLTIDAAEYPAFEAGTHLALISYYVEGFYRARQGDEKSFDTICNTRLFAPIVPTRFTNSTESGRSRADNLRGLDRRLSDKPGEREHGAEEVPVHIDGKTYRLPIRFWVFAAPGAAGERRNFVAQGHCVVFISNGQVHHHWTPQDFRYKTDHLQKLADRLFVVVNTDDLPIEVRTSLFTADRMSTVRSQDADKLERAVLGVLDDWDELREINGAIIRDALTQSDKSVSTINVARQIGRAFRELGFGGTAAAGGGNGGGGSAGVKRPPKRPEELYPDPTYFQGPESVELLVDRTTGVMFALNAQDGFIPERGVMTVECDHPDLRADEITVGSLHNGRLRVLLAVPDTAAVGTGWKLTARIEPWLKANGGLGGVLEWTTELTVATSRTPVKPPAPKGGTGDAPGTGTGTGAGTGDKGGPGDLLPVIWGDPNSTNGWDGRTPGTLESMRASDIATALPEYAEALSLLGDTEIRALQLNNQYGPFKKYVQHRTSDTSDQGIMNAKNRYAVGVGVGLALLSIDFAKLRKTETIPEAAAVAAHQAIARAVLANMPQYDELAKETGVEKGLGELS